MRASGATPKDNIEVEMKMGYPVNLCVPCGEGFAVEAPHTIELDNPPLPALCLSDDDRPPLLPRFLPLQLRRRSSLCGRNSAPCNRSGPYGFLPDQRWPDSRHRLASLGR